MRRWVNDKLLRTDDARGRFVLFFFLGPWVPLIVAVIIGNQAAAYVGMSLSILIVVGCGVIAAMDDRQPPWWS